MLFGLFFFLAMSALFFVFAFLFLVKQKITLIHDYHYTHVQKSDIPAYTRLYGYAMLGFGGGCLLMGILNFLLDSPLGWPALLLGMTAGFFWIIKAQFRYNREKSSVR